MTKSLHPLTKQAWEQLVAENEKMLDLLEDCAYQGCSHRTRKRAKNVDLCHNFMSTYEELLDFLVEKGRLRWVKRGVWATAAPGRKERP